MRRYSKQRLFEEVMGIRTKEELEKPTQANPKTTSTPNFLKKLYLNIPFLNKLFRRKNQIVTSQLVKKKVEEERNEGSSNFISKVSKVCQLILGYGIVGSLGLSLLCLLLPLPTNPITSVVRSSIWISMIVAVLGTGAIAYLFFDLNLFLADLRNRGMEKR